MSEVLEQDCTCDTQLPASLKQTCSVLEPIAEGAYQVVAEMNKISVDDLINYLLTGYTVEDQLPTQLQCAVYITLACKQYIKQVLGEHGQHADQHVDQANQHENITEEKINESAQVAAELGINIILSRGCKIIKHDKPVPISSGLIEITGQEYDIESIFYLHKLGYNIILR